MFVLLLGVQALLQRNSLERADAVLRSVAGAAVSMLGKELSESGLDELAARDAVKTLNFPSQTIAIFDARRDLLAERPIGISEQIRAADSNAAASESGFHLFSTPAGEYGLRRVAVTQATLPPVNRTYTVITSYPLSPLLIQLDTDRRLLVSACLLGLVLAAWSGWFLARRSLAPVQAMSEQAYRISVENLDRRLPGARRNDELGRLAATFNDLLERLSAAIGQQRQFMADASHELRNPVHVIRAAAAVTLEKPDRDQAEYRQALEIVDRQSQRLARIVEDMFRMARADSGHLPMQPQWFYLDELAAEAVRTARMLASGKELSVELDPCGESPCLGDEGFLRQMLMNLIENAVRHTAAGGEVRVSLQTDGEDYLILVSDTGSGIPAEAQPRIFERFYRVEKSGSAAGSGAGLGLSIAQWIALAHKGGLRLIRSGPEGTVFEARIPAGGDPAA